MRACFTILLLSVVINAWSQKDYSGFYSLDGETYNRELTLLRIDSFHYKFWITAAGKNFANTCDGIVGIKKRSGVFTIPNDNNACGILFVEKNDTFNLEVPKNTTGCSVAFGSHIFGTYPLIKRGAVKQSEFVDLYIDEERNKVIAEKSILYKDPECKVSKNQYFLKGDILIHPMDGGLLNKSLYVEYMSAKGIFVFGWVKRSDVQKINN